jgi:hypothetical protein
MMTSIEGMQMEIILVLQIESEHQMSIYLY